MRLLNVYTKQLEEFPDNVPKYAILSHTWGQDEVVFQDLSNPSHKQKSGYAKIEGCCRQAIDDRYNYVWVDTCCIDKSSSTELSEAINSMFKWYKSAEICYVYLVDVPEDDEPYTASSAFRKSRWFKRGWTLQELIAPPRIAFFSNSWTVLFRFIKSGIMLGESARRTSTQQCTGIENLLAEITTIPADIFISQNRYKATPKGARLSWASSRRTTRDEDLAYCLLGLVEVNMPLLYGEGMRSFVRLQEEILKTSNDLSILAWGYGVSLHEMETIVRVDEGHILAPSPSLFRGFDQYKWDTNIWTPPSSHSDITNNGLYIEILLLNLDLCCPIYLGILSQERRQEKLGRCVRCIGIPLYHNKALGIFQRTTECTPFLFEISTRCSRIKARKKRIYIQGGVSHSLVSDSIFASSCGVTLCFHPLVEAGYTLHSVFPHNSIYWSSIPPREELVYLDFMRNGFAVFLFTRHEHGSIAVRIKQTKHLLTSTTNDCRVSFAHADLQHTAFGYYAASHLCLRLLYGLLIPLNPRWESSLLIKCGNDGTRSGENTRVNMMATIKASYDVDIVSINLENG